jgi:hypothetical protein
MLSLLPTPLRQISNHRKANFNLKPELRNLIAPINFSPEFPIIIEATLQPDLLKNLQENSNSEETILNYLLDLAQKNPEHPLLQTESWFALSVTQKQPNREIGYTTLWNNLNPAKIASGDFSEEDIAAGLGDFFRSWTEENLGNITQKATEQALEEMSNMFTGFTNIDTKTNLIEELVKFFTEDDWTFTKLQGEPVLQTGFQGENGAWNCYATTREEQQQIAFYSIAPITAPENKRSQIAEFIARANYGMIIGNFELDFNDGEIRYKTSIDVSSDNLSLAIIKNLVYSNVMMMDEYLPGIMAVIETGVEPESAIAQVELATQ